MLKHLKKSMKSRKNQQLLACLFDSNCNCNSHTNHGVVTCADETHHFFAVDTLGELQNGMLSEKSYYIRLRVLLNHKIIFAKHIVCVFPENIISRFDVSVNDVAEEFAEMLRIFLLISIFPNKDKSNMLDKLYGKDYAI